MWFFLAGVFLLHSEYSREYSSHGSSEILWGRSDAMMYIFPIDID